MHMGWSEGGEKGSDEQESLNVEVEWGPATFNYYYY